MEFIKIFENKFMTFAKKLFDFDFLTIVEETLIKSKSISELYDYAK